MAERQYAEAGGKQYPLKTTEERATAQSSPAAMPSTQRQSSSEGSSSVNIPTPHGSRTVMLAMLVSFGTFALAGDTGISKLSRLQGYLGASGATGATGANALTSVRSDSGAGGGGTPTASVFSPRAIFGWMMLFVMLTILSDFDATSELAGAFAMLIMLTTLLTLGPDAFANLNKLTKVVK